MSPLPLRLVDRWAARDDLRAGQARLYWHILMGGHPQARAAGVSAQRRIGRFPGLHLTPADRLHVTLLPCGLLGETSPRAVDGMVRAVTLSLSRVPPVDITIGRVLYHPEAVTLGVRPAGALGAVREAVRDCSEPHRGEAGREWVPHMTIAYSTADQPAGPVIAALGHAVPDCPVRISSVSLVAQHGPERDWDWRNLAEIPLGG